ncbi:hypothetical protein CYFUS_004973 [Cystobacter fuscus]|uniref:Carboxypeptidase regulatory-like domain-containing protein n=1 Tax=Cystobacter fuscus TaxID=43 RepID=A0A250J6G7_9BACT|nr:hypothetical protein [Cystobacter fuscus]ATB39529.1 hypothetical protein CYFUS_004973 [Cystobacter fuscus]
MKNASLVWSCCAALVLSACGDNPPAPITVTGKVFGDSLQAVSKASILIPGNGRQPVAVDGSGAFSISGVTPPYDVIVADKERRVATVFMGLTLETLTVPLELDTDAAQPDPEHEATVEGTVTGEQPSSAIATTNLLFASTGGDMSGSVEPSGTYSLNVDWSGATSATGTIYALQSESSSPGSLPTRYLAFGQRDNVTVSKDATLPAQDIALSPVTNSRLAGNYIVPEGYALSLSTLSLAFKPGSEFSLGFAFASSGAFDYAVPQIPQTTFSILAFAIPRDAQGAEGTLLFKRGLTAGTTNVSVEIQASARPAQPADAAKDVTRTTEFSWSPFAGGVHVLTLQEDKSKNQTPYTVTLYTSGTQTTLPDLSAFGMDLPANTEFTWKIQGFGPAASMDALIGLVEHGNPLEQGTGDISVSTSETRTFTTAATP